MMALEPACPKDFQGGDFVRGRNMIVVHAAGSIATMLLCHNSIQSLPGQPDIVSLFFDVRMVLYM